MIEDPNARDRDEAAPAMAPANDAGEFPDEGSAAP